VTQGLRPGQEAFDRDIEQLRFSKNDAVDSALLSSILGGGAEQSRIFGLGGAERERAIQEQAFQRNIPLNEVAALLGTGGVNIPQFGAPPQTGVANTDVLGAVGLQQQALNNAFNQQSQNATAFNTGLFGLGSAGIGALPSFF